MAAPPSRLMHMTERTSVPPPQGLLQGCHPVRFQLGWIRAIEGEGVLGAGDVGVGVGDGVGTGDGGAVGVGVGGNDFNTDSTFLPISVYPLCTLV